MSLIQGLLYNFRGLRMGLTSGRLLFWGMIRFVVVIAITIILGGIVLAYRVELTEAIWMKPGSIWVAWIWHVFSWFITLLLTAFSALLSFLASQVLFSAIIMDHMSRITESRATGHVIQAENISVMKYLFHLIRQEIPRLTLPLLVSFLLFVLSWMTPFGPVLVALSAALSAIFLSWDNTDLVPARRLIPFRTRMRFLFAAIPFHIGFGLPFLIPGLNLLFLSFAPIGATLYYVERHDFPGRKKGAEARPAERMSPDRLKSPELEAGKITGIPL